MLRLLHNTQQTASTNFAYHAMEGLCRACNFTAMEIRLRQFRERLGLTLEQLAERTSFSVSQLSRWEAGKSNVPSERLPELAALYQCRIADIFAEDESPFLPVGPRLYVKGEVQAGVWKEVWEQPQDEWSVFTGRSDVVAPLADRFGLRVVGDSMNDVYPPGTIVECVSFLGGAEIENGRRVIVQRRRDDLEYEVTVKEYQQSPDGTEWLLPRSSNPAFQTPYRVGDHEPGITDVQIIGIVVASIRPE